MPLPRGRKSSGQSCSSKSVAKSRRCKNRRPNRQSYLLNMKTRLFLPVAADPVVSPVVLLAVAFLLRAVVPLAAAFLLRAAPIPRAAFLRAVVVLP
jgi:hypothetical protein